MPGNKTFVWDALTGMRSLEDAPSEEYSPNLTGRTFTYASDASTNRLIIIRYDLHDGTTDGL